LAQAFLTNIVRVQRSQKDASKKNAEILHFAAGVGSFRALESSMCGRGS